MVQFVIVMVTVGGIPWRSHRSQRQCRGRVVRINIVEVVMVLVVFIAAVTRIIRHGIVAMLLGVFALVAAILVGRRADEEQ